MVVWPRSKNAMFRNGQKGKFQDSFCFKSDTVLWPFLFPVFLSLFCCCIIFSCFALRLVGFTLQLVGKVFSEAFRILRLDERKDWWVVKEDFHLNVLGESRMLQHFCLFLQSLTELCSLWCVLKDVLTPHTLAENLPFAVKTHSRDVDCYRQLRANQGCIC